MYVFLQVNIQKSIDLPIYRHKRVSVCVKAICPSGLSDIKCTQVKSTEATNEFVRNHIYEFNRADVDVNKLRQLTYARFIGENLKDFHSTEINFCPSNIKLVGAILFSANRPIKWFLMKNNSIPVNRCEDSDHCIESIHSDGGVGLFKRHILVANIKYFVCARAEEFVIHGETTDEIMPILNLCGNGFYVDNEPPAGGSVRIKSGIKGYISSSHEVYIVWSGFMDIEQYVRLLHGDGIIEYHIALGISIHYCICSFGRPLE